MSDRKPAEPQDESVEDYFLAVVHQAFDEYFVMRGARCEDLGPNLVRYETPHWYVETYFRPSEGPKYSPRVHVGVLPKLLVEPCRNDVDIRHLVPEGNDLRQYNLLWSYATRSEALAVFTRARDEILKVFIDPYFDNMPELRAFIKRRNDEMERRYREDIRDHNDGIRRREADAAFQAVDYEAVVRHLSAMSEESFTPSLRMKLEIARKRT